MGSSRRYFNQIPQLIPHTQNFTALYFGDIRPYYDGRLQVVGHTPVDAPLYEEEKGLLTLDTFSTDQDGVPVGDCRFCVIDTVEQIFRYADEILSAGGNTNANVRYQVEQESGL